MIERRIARGSENLMNAVPSAASSPESLKVILIGVCVTLPVIIAYTGFSYRVFRGKTIELDYA
jgi:cytochrome bd-type quinol oxidase subunit 2